MSLSSQKTALLRSDKPAVQDPPVCAGVEDHQLPVLPAESGGASAADALAEDKKKRKRRKSLRKPESELDNI